MNNIVTNWNNIIEESVRLGMPPSKKRGILREYLQTLILNELYAQKISSKLSFIGGTSLRLIRNLNRFSEDLDFDNLGATDDEFKKVLINCSKALYAMNIEHEFVFDFMQPGIGHGSFKFLSILEELNISSDPREKVRVEVDVTSPSKARYTEHLVYARYGLTSNILTNTLPTLAMQKIDAFLNRKDPKGRDLYDIYWLLSKNVKPQLDVSINAYKDHSELKIAILNRYTSLENDLDKLIKSLTPFLFDDKQVINLKYFPQLIEQKL